MNSPPTTSNNPSSPRPHVVHNPVAQHVDFIEDSSPQGNHSLGLSSPPSLLSSPPPTPYSTSPKKNRLPNETLKAITLLGDVALNFIKDSKTAPSSPLSRSSTPPSSSTSASASVPSNSAINAQSLITKEFTAEHFCELTEILLSKKNNFPSDKPLAIPEKSEEKLRNDVLLQKILKILRDTNTNPAPANNGAPPSSSIPTNLSKIPLCLDQLCTLINDCHLWLKNTFRNVEAEVNTTKEFHNLGREDANQRKEKDIILDNTKEILQIYYYLIKALLFLQKEHKR